MEKKKHAYTPVKKIRFEYIRISDGSLRVFRNSKDHEKFFTLSKDIIDSIIEEIKLNSPTIMGTSRKNPPKGSVGYGLIRKDINPQCLSYVVPLLIEEGFCEVDKKTHEIKIIK